MTTARRTPGLIQMLRWNSVWCFGVRFTNCFIYLYLRFAIAVEVYYIIALSKESSFPWRTYVGRDKRVMSTGTRPG